MTYSYEILPNFVVSVSIFTLYLIIGIRKKPVYYVFVGTAFLCVINYIAWYFTVPIVEGTLFNFYIAVRQILGGVKDAFLGSRLLGVDAFLGSRLLGVIKVIEASKKQPLRKMSAVVKWNIGLTILGVLIELIVGVGLKIRINGRLLAPLTYMLAAIPTAVAAIVLRYKIRADNHFKNATSLQKYVFMLDVLVIYACLSVVLASYVYGSGDSFIVYVVEALTAIRQMFLEFACMIFLFVNSPAFKHSPNVATVLSTGNNAVH
eukprot:CAMPEP_0117889498 /NCGR_PEP_ID=MMETSP0950-20121206/22654_1 /TAXON_ID=44440 /ORGANISM="Chattonella subsalsa, Strain CCMP2191" /LENGTH=261 /DNA_ID=CAMNT_0005748353 /DNA_START=259 /DNA_END=1044 /DNA_ORIENTATION=+